LPEGAPAVANYVPWKRSGNVVQISGQLSNDNSGGYGQFIDIPVVMNGCSDLIAHCFGDALRAG
jgi:enamine deaminase RidA (YjgF/YER057c/UK114 family)